MEIAQNGIVSFPGTQPQRPIEYRLTTERGGCHGEHVASTPRRVLSLQPCSSHSVLTMVPAPPNVPVL